jgi:hypothetical protein
MPRTLAYRRHQRERVLKRASHVLEHVWLGSMNPDRAIPQPAYKYADNLCKCSCEFCQPGSSGRQVKRADAREAWERKRMKENWE